MALISGQFCYQETLCVLIYGEFFVDPTRNVNYQEKQNSEKIQRVMIRLSVKTNDINLTISSNLLYFKTLPSRVRKP